MDSEVDRFWEKVFRVYDKKNTGQLKKSDTEQFFKDFFELYCLRQGRKKKDVVPKGYNEKKALAGCLLRINPSGSGIVTKQEFEQFMNTYDQEEILQDFLSGDGIDINTNNINWVDTSQFANLKREGPQLVYRDYPDD